jgi:hypothetical protein
VNPELIALNERNERNEEPPERRLTVERAERRQHADGDSSSEAGNAFAGSQHAPRKRNVGGTEYEAKGVIPKQHEHDVRDDIRGNIRVCIGGDIRCVIRRDIRDDIRGDIRGIRDDIRDHIRDDIRGDIRDDIRGDIHDAIRCDIRYDS